MYAARTMALVHDFFDMSLCFLNILILHNLSHKIFGAQKKHETLESVIQNGLNGGIPAHENKVV